MSTRGLTMVVSNNETKVAQYGKYDQYPSGNGLCVLRIILEIVKNGDLNLFRNQINVLRWFTDDEWRLLQEMRETELLTKYPQLSTDWGGLILEAIYKGSITTERTEFRGNTSSRVTETTIFPNIGVLQNDSNFAGDSLFCEWAYVIDLDKCTFEVYKGFNETFLDESERFYELQITTIAKNEEKGINTEYYPVKLVQSFDLNNLPNNNEFLATFTYNEEE